jgi:hypothetical protein
MHLCICAVKAGDCNSENWAQGQGCPGVIPQHGLWFPSRLKVTLAIELT